MRSVLHIVTKGQACSGMHLVLAAGNPGSTEIRKIGQEAVEMGLTAILGEQEASGIEVPRITLWANSAVDALGVERGGWVEWALRWLHAHGRRSIVRTRHVLARSLVDAIAEMGVGVELEIAHQRARVQRALLDRFADPASALLLQSQNLASRKIPVWARVAPLLPGIHDQETDKSGFEALVRNLIAADLHDATLEVGVLHAQQIFALHEAVGPGGLSAGGLLKLGRFFGLDPVSLLSERPARTTVFQMRRYSATALAHELTRVATRIGLRTNHCGCSTQCHLWPSAAPSAPYLSVVGPDLFAGQLTG